MFSDFLLVIMWILGVFLMAGITSEDQSVSRFLAVIFWPFALLLVLVLWGWDEFKFRVRQRQKQKGVR